MTSMPKPVRLFHITAIDNLTAICEQGALYISFPRSCVGMHIHRPKPAPFYDADRFKWVTHFYPPRSGEYRF